MRKGFAGPHYFRPPVLPLASPVGLKVYSGNTIALPHRSDPTARHNWSALTNARRVLVKRRRVPAQATTVRHWAIRAGMVSMCHPDRRSQPFSAIGPRSAKIRASIYSSSRPAMIPAARLLAYRPALELTLTHRWPLDLRLYEELATKSPPD